MSLLIVYGEEKVKTDKNGAHYNSGAYSRELWNLCYQKLDEDVTFMSRQDTKIYEVDEVTSKFNPIPKNVKFEEIKNNKNGLRDFFSLKLRREIKNEIRTAVMESDAVITRIPSDYSYYAINYALKYNKKLVVEVVGSALHSMWYHSIKGKLLALPSYLREKKYVKISPNVIYVTENFLQELYPSPGKSIGCSDVCLDQIDNSVLIQKLNKYFLNENHRIVLGTCGAINVPYKGHRYVLEALSRLKQKGYSIEYQIVGGGDSDAIIDLSKQLRVEDQVKVIGPLEHDKVFPWLINNVDIYVQPSDTEGLSRALLEAISVGCVCIASKVGGNAEIIDPQYTFPRANVNVLCDKIENFILHPQQMCKVSEDNFIHSKAYDKTKLFARRLDFYRKNLGE